VGCSAFFFLIYGGANWLASTRGQLPSIRFAWERFIPFVPATIVPYVSIDLLFFGSFFLYRNGRELHRHARRILFVIAVAGLCFLLFPLEMTAARPVVDGFWAPWFKPLHALDRPHNLVPSLHCALAAVLLAAYVVHTRGRVRNLVYAWFALIGASTLLTYQHHAIDVVSGAALGLLALWIFPEPFTPAPRARRWDAAARYALISVALAAGALALGPTGWPLYWPAGSCAIVGFGYAGAGAGVFRKRDDGSVPLATRALLLPYLTAARIAHSWHARGSAPCVSIAPQLFIGSRFAGASAASVVDLAVECDGSHTSSGAYLNLAVLDGTPPTVEQLERAVRFISQHVPRDRVHVRCALGLSRSACVAAAWMIERGIVDDVDEAVATVRDRQPRAVIDARMLTTLQQFALTRAARRARAHPRTAAALPAP
jgi:protein-tyrosine phosphatase/membrane-associated phospholipid phosphatase